MKYKITTYIADMTKEDQVKIEDELRDYLQSDYTGDELRELVEDGMDSRLSDLQDVIDITPYFESEKKEKQTVKKQNIEIVDQKFVNDLLDSEDSNYKFKPLGRFIFTESGSNFISIDNTDGDAYFEDHDNFESAYRHLIYNQR